MYNPKISKNIQRFSCSDSRFLQRHTRLIRYAQSMDLRNPWIVLRKVAIDTLRNKVWICCTFHGLSAQYFAQSMHQADEILFYFEVTRTAGLYFEVMSCIWLVTA